MKSILRVERENTKATPEFTSGDTIKVYVQVVEGEKVRSQIFQGVVMGRRGGGLRETFTVRKISNNVGVERIFPLHSPTIVKIEKIREGRVRRAKLTYLRDLRGKAARITGKDVSAVAMRAEEKRVATAQAARDAEMKALSGKDAPAETPEETPGE